MEHRLVVAVVKEGNGERWKEGRWLYKGNVRLLVVMEVFWTLNASQHQHPGCEAVHRSA